MLQTDLINAGYGEVQVLFDISIEIKEKETVALIGANGAGKTTLLRVISGAKAPYSGTINYFGEDLTGYPSYELANKGVIHVPEGKHIFYNLTVEENLLMGAYVERARKDRKQLLENVYSLFPVLKQRRGQRGGTLSGGEQQMLALGRALMGKPNYLLLDEPSLGLAPNVVDAVFDAIQKIKEEGLSILLVEQDIQRSLELAERGYVLESGRVVLQGESKELMSNKSLSEKYFGL